eukprot:1193674-Prorocentrum_minimum.AAC.4
MVLHVLDVARPRSDAQPDFRSVRAKRAKLLGGDPPAGDPGKEAAKRRKVIPNSLYVYVYWSLTNS